jgi:hypothetical protein
MLKLSIEHPDTLPSQPPPILTPSLEIWRDSGGSVYAYGQSQGEECWMHVPGVATFRFTRQGDEVAAAVAQGAETDLILDAYRRRVLPMAVQVRGFEILHASAVRSEQGVIGLCGVTQTGKSTIAFGLSQRGYGLWCDDALAFDFLGGKMRAISLPFQLRLRPTAMDLFREQFSATPEKESESNPPGYETSELAALCVLRRTDDAAMPVSVQRLAFAQAFLAVLSHACWFTFEDAEDKRRVIDHYMDLAAKVPVFDVSFKSGLESLPAVLDAIETAIDAVACQT